MYGTFIANNYTSGIISLLSTPAVTAPAPSLSGGAIAGITIAVILAVLIILAIVIVIAMVEYKRRASKQPKIKRHDKEQVSVDFDKQWLMEDHELPKKRVSFKNYIFGSQPVTCIFLSYIKFWSILSMLVRTCLFPYREA